MKRGKTKQQKLNNNNPFQPNGNGGVFGAYGNYFNPYQTDTTQLSQVGTIFKNMRWYFISNQRQPLSEAYSEIGLVRTICDVPVQDAFRGGIEIETQDLDARDIFDLQSKMEQEGDLNIAAQTCIWNRLFGGAGTVISTDQDPEQPLNMKLLKPDSKLQFLSADLWELFWDAINVNNEYDDTYAYQNLPESEWFQFYDVRLHRSRVMTIKGVQAPSFVRPRLRGWGLSEIEWLIRSINQYLKATDLSFEVLDEFKIDVYRLKNLANAMMAPNGMAGVQARVSDINRGKNYQKAIVLDQEDEYTQKQLSFAGLAEAMDGIRKQVAADMRMPLSKLFGVGSQGFSSGEDDIENYNSMVEQIRAKSKFHIIKIVQLRCQQLFGYVPEDLTIKFKPLRILSSEQEENVKTQKFNRILQAKQAGLITDAEARDAFNKDSLINIQLDEKNIKDLVKPDDTSDDTGSSSVKAPKSTLNAPNVKNSESDKYNLINFQGPRIVTVGLKSGSKILTGRRRDNGLWTSPGGHMDAGETVEAAAIREVLEETGINIDREQLKLIDSRMITSLRTGKDFALFAFIAEIDKMPASGKNDPDAEIAEWKWVDIDKATHELKPEMRHAKSDAVLNYLFNPEGEL